MVTRSYKNPVRAIASVGDRDVDVGLIHGDAFEFLAALPDESVDLIFSSPPYCMGKTYETSSSVADFVASHESLLPHIPRVLKSGGSLCWQVGYHSDGKQITPLDFLAHGVFARDAQLRLKNRVVWSFAHGLHASKRFSGRHEVVLWYTKGASTAFDLDAVRVPQKYPGKRSYKGPRKGELSGNPLGKNPGDVWELPNVKGNHIEKTVHPCQFPVALPQTFIRALCATDALVVDPFMGVGTTGVAAALEGKRFLGSELQKEYVQIAKNRVSEALRGTARYRPIDKPIEEPRPGSSVAKRPQHFKE